MTPRLQVPNLDGCTDYDLEQLRETFHKLYQYCAFSAEARRLRRVGLIRDALRNERAAQEAYESLPSEARW